MGSKLLIVAFLVAMAFNARAQSPATLRAVDVYRSSVFTPAEAHRRFDARLRNYLTLRNVATPSARAKAESLRLEMQKEAELTPGVAWAELQISEYFTSVDHSFYAVFDVVDKSDRSRLSFSPAPRSAFADPGGLLAAWRKYVAAGEALSQRGELSVERPNCPGFYCLWGGTPQLDAAQKVFVAGAARRSRELRRVLNNSADGDARAAALFVLSYSTAGSDVVSLCRGSLSDPDAKVRGAALQILADIANGHPELLTDIGWILPRLDDPVVSVRNKTMGLLVPLASRDAYRPELLRAAMRVATLLKLAQPESRDLAFTILSILSKKNYDRQDYPSWDAWAAGVADR